MSLPMAGHFELTQQYSAVEQGAPSASVPVRTRRIRMAVLQTEQSMGILLFC